MQTIAKILATTRANKEISLESGQCQLSADRGELNGLYFNSYNPIFRMVFIHVDRIFSFFRSTNFYEFLPT